MLVEYAQAVINDDWPALACDRLGQQAGLRKRQLAIAILELKPATPAQDKGALRMFGTLVTTIVLTFIALFAQERWLFMLFLSAYVGFCTYMMGGAKHQYFWHVCGFVCMIICMSAGPEDPGIPGNDPVWPTIGCGANGHLRSLGDATAVGMLPEPRGRTDRNVGALACEFRRSENSRSIASAA
ncbi:MAG: FUSC family protein [Deltaproteobacteria bacterium]|nr:FUSC family protein [Deltaproteobacteria bacterium]